MPPERPHALPHAHLVSSRDARRLFLGAQGLLDDPANCPAATPRRVTQLIERLGFVQVDTISTVERAHHLILAPRLNGYRPPMLAKALERDRSLFEHWTHDASIIPIKWYPHWQFRFERYRAGTWLSRQLGPDVDRILAEVLARITRDGPLSSRDFEHDGPPGATSWWRWKPAKIALDHLWRIGKLHVLARKNFQKVYDVCERVIPRHVMLPKPTEAEHVDWACRTALDRLGTATIREIAQFWHAVSASQVTDWLNRATASGDVIPVQVESADGSAPRPAFAPFDYRARLARLPDAPRRARLLCPFDPVLRDRPRAKRLFNFDFRFEGFVPAANRKHGYYVMPILEGERFVGKADPKFDRASGMLLIRKVWWEPHVKPTRGRSAAFADAAEKLAAWIGAEHVVITT